jgi:large subunit ribosomal protein L35
MPKMKSHSGARKRFKVTGTGKVRRRNSNLNHILEKKAPKRKRNLRGTSEVAKSDLPTIKHLLGK